MIGNGTVIEELLLVLTLIACLYALATAFIAFRTIRGVPLVEDLQPRTPKSWPRVSVIVPACNEEESIEQAMRTRLGEEYPNAEYLLVDDRSTDRTGAIIDELAKDPRIVPLHVKTLPAGWLGKVHAMQYGFEHATGDWLLFSDADVHHEPGALARLVAHCEETGIDHVAVFPSIWRSGFGIDVLMNSLVHILVTFAFAWKVADPKSRASVGGGVFCLVRRSALERAGGLAQVKLEVVDDAALGQLLKWSGARQAVFNARGFVGLYFYRSIGEAIRGMEKNGFGALGRFSVARFLGIMTLIIALEIGPFALAVVDHRALIACAIGIGAQLAVSRWAHRPLLPTLFAPVGMALLMFGGFRSMFLTLARGGIDWRGTRYTLAELRAGMRLVI